MAIDVIKVREGNICTILSYIVLKVLVIQIRFLEF